MDGYLAEGFFRVGEKECLRGARCGTGFLSPLRLIQIMDL